MKTEGMFWYSEKQLELCHSMGETHRNYCQLEEDDKIVEYTEWMSGGHMMEKSNWGDAICLGMGKYHHTEGGI